MSRLGKTIIKRLKEFALKLEGEENLEIRPMSYYEIKTDWIEYGIILASVQNYYLVEQIGDNIWQWGVKYDSGQFEFFTFNSQEKAEEELEKFRTAIKDYYV